MQRRGIAPRIDVEGILREYASVEYVRFPVGIDGLCQYLKVPGQRPTVMVNERSAHTRQRFTLAHELGHVLIAWHIGNIVDNIDVDDTLQENYYTVEAEANRFASELLMPTRWVQDLLSSHYDPIDVLFRIGQEADVSLPAAAIKLKDCLPPNYAIARSIGAKVVWSSRSAGTLAAVIPRDTDLNASNPYSFPCEKWERADRNTRYHIWHFTTIEGDPVVNDQRPWREIFDEIIQDIIPEELLQNKFKASVNGVTSNANGSVRSNRTADSVITAMLHRLHAVAARDSRFQIFLDHPQFRSFCKARAQDFIK